MKKPTRPEQDVLAELAVLCRQPGYVHAVATLCFRDNVILHTGDMKEADMRRMFEPSRLIRTEINTVLGLMIKAEIDWTLPAPKTLQQYVEASERLLKELHDCLSGEFFSGLTKEAMESGTFNPFERGEVLREPIFYGGESAYNFQYLDLAARKYAADGSWLQANQGFTIDQASRVAKAVEAVQADHLSATRERLRKQHPDEWTMVHLFAFAAQEIVAKTGLATVVVDKVLGAFELASTERNAGFNTLHDFNVITATPLLRMPSGDFLSLQSYSLAESIYDSPYYWMVQDKAYGPTLNKNRGDFTEDFVAERLGLVFGTEHVHRNVDIFETKADKVTDIDVLVVWANRVIIVQAKSKRLTLEARKGNDQVIRDDFKKSVQAAYDQGAVCPACLLDKRYRFETQGGEVVLPPNIKEIYLFCVVSDHYPALSFQARQFLQTRSIDRVQAPLVMDIFTVDAMTEMLQSPLQFLSYVNRRANYAEQLMASQELTILGFHLTKNLWVEPDVNLMLLADDFSAGLDIAMAVRRTGVQGAATPDGVLTCLESTTVGRIVKEIETRPDPATVDLGFLLLAMSEQAVTEMSRVVNRLAARTRADGKVHDATFAFNEGSGITFHCTDEPPHVAGPRLDSYCKRRKYKEKAKEWFGLCMRSRGPDVRFGIALTYPWFQDSTMDEDTRDMQVSMPIDQAIQAVLGGRSRAKKVGRNDPCPCGSGFKYKKCCLN
jgi:hypothetical protein